MNSTGPVRAFVGLWWTVGIVICFLSARTAWRARQGAFPHGRHLMMLAAVEAICSLLFLLPRTMRMGAAGLLLTFALAFFVHVAQGQFPAELLIYAASVTYVALHGPVAPSDSGLLG